MDDVLTIDLFTNDNEYGFNTGPDDEAVGPDKSTVYLKVFRRVPRSNGLYRTAALVEADALLAVLEKAGIMPETLEENR